MQQFNIDISRPRGPLVLYVSQGDSLSRFFSITVTDNGAAYTPPDGAIYTVRFGAPGMPAGWYDTITEVGGSTHPAVVVDENTLTVELAEQALSKPGTNKVVVIVSDAEGYNLASWAFELQVEAVPGYDAPEATVYYNALTEQVAQTLANAQAAAASASESAASATLSESWAVGGTSTREGEDTNNAQYWAQQAQQVSQGALGWYETEQALQAAHPTGTNGQWAIVGSTDTIWTWDSDTSAWVNSGDSTDLSNYYTIDQANAAFATAAQGALAASAVQSVNGKTGTAVTLSASDVGAAPAADGISTYTCATTGSTHALTGTGNNIKFVADAAFAAGDTITVNGQVVTAQTQSGAALTAGAWAAGATVVCYLDGETLNFNGGNTYTPPAYSTTPVDTGKKWIDGKSIYQVVLQFTTGPLNTATYIPVNDVVDTFIFASCMYAFNGGIYAPGPSFAGTSSATPLSILQSCNNNSAASNKNTISNYVWYSSYANVSAFAIVEYTRDA